MVEPLLYGALGFLVAVLLALFACRALWNRAVRLTRKRMLRRLPLSQSDIVASRDMLRAEHAIETRRLEVQVNRLSGSVRELKISLQDREKTVSRLEGELAEARMMLGTYAIKDNAAAEEIAENAKELSENAGDLAEARANVAALTRKLEKTEADRAELRVIADSRQIKLAALATDIATLEDRARRLEQDIAKSHSSLAEANARAAAATKERDEGLGRMRNDLEQVETDREKLATALRATLADQQRLRRELATLPSVADAERLTARLEELAAEIARVAEPGAPQKPRRETREADAPRAAASTKR